MKRERTRGLRIYPIFRARDDVNGLERLPIAQARSELQAHLYVFAHNRPDSVVWILDDDMRLNPLVAEESGTVSAAQTGTGAVAAGIAPTA